MDKTSFIIIICLLVIIFDTIFLSFIFKGLSIFNEDYEKLKAGCGEPLNSFDANILNLGPFLLKYGKVTISLYSGCIIIRFNQKALLVKDLSMIKLSGKFASSMLVSNGTRSVRIHLNPEHYSVIYKYLEERQHV